ncbi:alcohol dehydrogenase [Apiospora kogelbergensis]|uniref:enoyl-[acyl-carrier-protein] reductase n=1 Tax=Apiospora kogelbergensis TaxID=1337665 RepID=A0AAW0Q550_9PEZI
MSHTLVQDPAISAAGLRLVAHDPATLDVSHTKATAGGSDGDDRDDQVHVRFLASPINRVDMMLLAGRYPIKPKYTQDGQPIPGFDGCGVVVQCSSPSSNLKPGDLVIPRGLGLGTWRREAVVPSSALVKLPSGIPPLGGALLRSGALIAWLLLEAVRPLERGDCVIMSAGTSSVAHFLVQLARRRGIDVVLVVRDRDVAELDKTRNRLLGLGAAAVLSETELASGKSASAPLLSKHPPVLALDCVYGRVGQLLLDCLAPKGTFSLVGLLAGPQASINVTTQHLFTKQLAIKPFRGSEILNSMGEAKADELIGHVAGLLAQGSLIIPHLTVVSWERNIETGIEDRLINAVEKAKKDNIGTGKIVWVFE